MRESKTASLTTMAGRRACHNELPAVDGSPDQDGVCHPFRAMRDMHVERFRTAPRWQRQVRPQAGEPSGQPFGGTHRRRRFRESQRCRKRGSARSRPTFRRTVIRRFSSGQPEPTTPGRWVAVWFFIIPEGCNQLRCFGRGPAQSTQFVEPEGHRGFERQRTQVGGFCILALELQDMPELQIRVGYIGIE